MSGNNWQIVVADRGWVYVGIVSRDGDKVVIDHAHNIRRWGTTGGLGELALEGPKSETLLDHYGRVKIHVLAVCGGEVECESDVWDRWLEKQVAATLPKSKRK